MAPPRCIISFGAKSDTDSSAIELTFSHSKYDILYMKYLNRKTQDQPTFSYIESHIVGSPVTVKTGMTWRLENDFLIFDSKNDALRWKIMIPFCATVGASELSEARKELNIDEKPWLLKVKKELNADDFKKALDVPDMEWKSLWETAVCLDIPRASARRESPRRESSSSEEIDEPEAGKHGFWRFYKLWGRRTNRKA